MGPAPAVVVVAASTIVPPIQPGFGVSMTPLKTGFWFTTIALVLVKVAVPAHPATVALMVYTPALPAASEFTLASVRDVGFVMEVPPGLVHV